jgi:hypothetical protein
VQGLDLGHVKRIFEASQQALKDTAAARITPLRPSDVRRVDDISDGEEMRWGRLGARLIAEARLSSLACASTRQSHCMTPESITIFDAC